MKEIAYLVKKLRNQGVLLAVKENSIEVSFLKENIEEEAIIEIRTHKESIIDYLKKIEISNENSDISKAEESDSYPVTSTQSSIWIQENLERDKNLYNIISVIEIYGNIDIEKLEKSFDQLVCENEILRTCFQINSEGIIRQHINESKLNFNVYQENILIEKIIENEFSTRFDLTTSPLFRVSLKKECHSKYIMVLNIHHLICDGWSILLIKKKLIEIYFRNDQLFREKSFLELQFKDYAVWLNKQLSNEKIIEEKKYWVNRFRGISTLIDLPKKNNSSNKLTYEGTTFEYIFSEETATILNKIKNLNKVTLFTVLLSGIKSVLYKHTQQENIVVGVPYANRFNEKIENIVGPLINTFLIKSEFNNKTTFLSLLKQVSESLIEAQQNSLCSLEDWSFELKGKTRPVFNIMVVLQNFVDLFEYECEGLVFRDLEFSLKPSAQYDIVFRFLNLKGKISLKVEYKTDIFEREYIQNLIHHFENIIMISFQNQMLQIDQIDCLTKKEKLQLLDFNDTKIAYPENSNLVNLFEEQVKKTPNKIALKYYDKHLSYDELNSLSNRFSNYLLKNFSIEDEDRICVTIDKSENLIYVLLGILKTGACYVPIDPNYPAERRAYLKEISHANFLVDEDLVESFIKEKNNHSYHSPKRIIKPEALFHIMFTSGSTGNPKGVMLTHRNIVNFVSTNDYFLLNEETVLLSTVATSFDTTNLEFWGVLANGGELVLVDMHELFDYEKFKQIMNENKVNSLWLTASWFSQIVDQDSEIFRGLKQFISGGDVLSPKHIRKLKSKFPHLKIINGYGPTENTTFSTTYDIESSVPNNIPIGKPIKNSKVYILNDSLSLQPLGVFGKIFLSGENLAKGYFNDKELTLSKFIDNPFGKGIFYDTGDIGRWTPDGNIEFFGRKDSLVKIRGHRIELEEIESRVYQYSSTVEQVVVGVRGDNQEKQLVMYLVLASEIELKKIKNYLEEYLPSYMVPSSIIIIKEIPLTPNGKIDRKALDKIPLQNFNQNYEPGSNELEKYLINIWEKTLNRSTIGINDNFFDLGGDSLFVIKIINQIKKDLQITITFKEFYYGRTISNIVSYINNRIKGNNNNIPLTSKKEFFELSNAQKRIWLLSYQSSEVSNSYNIPLKLTIKTDESTLKKALLQLIESYEILRTKFVIVNQDPKQKIIPFEKLDISRIIEKVSTLNFEKVINKEINSVFDFENEPLIKVKYVLSDEHIIVFINIHHIIIDGWSFSVLIDQLEKMIFRDTKYESFNYPKIQYKDFSDWQNERIKSGQLNNQLEFWKLTFNEFRQIPLFTDFKREYTHKIEGQVLNFDIDDELVIEIENYISKNEFTKFVFYSSVISWIICHRYDRNDLVIGTLDANRDHIDLINQIGFFANTLAIPTNVDNYEFDEFVENTRNKIINCFDNKEYPFDLIVDKIKPNRNGSRLPFFDIMVIVQNIEYEIKNRAHISGEYLRQKQSKTDMIFEFVDKNKCRILYDSALYKTSTIEEIVIAIKCFLKEKFIIKDKKVNMNKLTKRKINSRDIEDVQFQVYEMLKEILPNKIIGLRDNFFELGGNSMDLMGLIIKISEKFEISLNIEEIIEDLTIINISEKIIKTKNNDKDN